MNITNTNLVRIEDIPTDKVDFVVVEVSKDTKKPKKINAKNFTEKIIEEYNIDNPADIPTLQEITDSGSITTSTISIGDTDAVYLSLGDNNIQGFDDSGIQTWSINNGTGQATFNDTFVNTISDANGEIKPYKAYVVLLEQDGTSADPFVSQENENNIGNIVWTRFAAGRYRGTLTGAFDETSTRIFLSIWPKYVNVEILAYTFNITSDYVEINISDETATTLVDGFRTDLEIRVYNP